MPGGPRRGTLVCGLEGESKQRCEGSSLRETRGEGEQLLGPGEAGGGGLNCWEGSGPGTPEVGEEAPTPLSDTGLRGRSPGPGRAGWEAAAIAPATFGDIEVEEIAVEDRLDQAGHDGDEVEEALEMIAPDPVEEIERAVDAQREQVVAGDGLRLARLAHHEQLRQDGHRLQVDGESPEDLQGAPGSGAEGRTRREGTGQERRQRTASRSHTQRWRKENGDSDASGAAHCVPGTALPGHVCSLMSFSRRPHRREVLLSASPFYRGNRPREGEGLARDRSRAGIRTKGSGVGAHRYFAFMPLQKADQDGILALRLPFQETQILRASTSLTLTWG